MKNKKSVIATGLTTIFLYFGFVLLLIIFFFIFKVTKEEVNLKIAAHIENSDVNYELFNYLRTPIIFEGKESNIAELIAVMNSDLAKKTSLDNKFLETMNEQFESSCAVICINGKQFRGSGCGSRNYECPTNFVSVPSYSNELIQVSLELDAQPLKAVRER